ncbi:MAG: hypothetical protein HRT89_24075, partial [Lentisphaeria bacterium]|nr:hypothetical protein [Lentisphaeria bacterium]
MNRFIYLIFCIIFMQIPAQAESGFFSLVPGKKELRVAQSGRIKIISSAKRQNLPIQVFFDQNNNGRFESNEKVCNGFSLNKSSEFKVGESTAGPVQVHYKSGQTDLTLYPLGELYFNNPKKQDWYLIINGNPKLVKAEKDMAIYQTSNGTWLAFETINRGTLKALANTVEQESNKALSIAVHMAASQKELEAIIASIRTPHEIKAGKTALTFNHARGLYQSKMTGDFSISKVSGSRPIIV